MNPDTFCSAPWFAIRLDWDGKYRPCCEFDEKLSNFTGRKEYQLHDTTADEWMSSEYSQYLRQELTNGNRLPECNNCWQKEKNAVKSFRQYTNDTVSNNQGDNLDNTWVKLFVNRNTNYQDYRLVSADVKLSNVCNFSCAMCSPYNSSKIYDKWQSNLDNTFVQEQLHQQPTFLKDIALINQSKRGYQHLKDILTHPLRNLKILGGEPLLDKELFRSLQDQPQDKKSQIHIEIVTNGSQDLVSAAKKLQGYKSVSFTISLEGIGDMQDYVRKGSHWPDIEQNILNAKRNGILVNVNYTMQAVSVLNLHELILWCHNNQIAISFGILEHPDYLEVSILPNNIRKLIIDNLSKIQDINIINSDNNLVLLVNGIIELIDNLPIIPGKYSRFLEYIAWYEQDSPVKLQDLCPELYFG